MQYDFPLPPHLYPSSSPSLSSPLSFSPVLTAGQAINAGGGASEYELFVRALRESSISKLVAHGIFKIIVQRAGDSTRRKGGEEGEEGEEGEVLKVLTQ